MADSTSVARNILEGVQTAIRQLNLSNIDAANVLIRRQPILLEDDDLPCVIISYGVEQLNQRGFNELDLNNYNVIVTIVTARDRTLDADAQFWESLAWRQQVRRQFNHSRLTKYGVSVGAIPNPMEVRSGEPFIAPAFRQNMDAQFLVVTVPVNESREQNE